MIYLNKLLYTLSQIDLLRIYTPIWGWYLKTRSKIIECKLCESKFVSMNGPDEDKYNQGDTCASTIELHKNGIWYISTHYGSDLDGNRYKFLVDPDECGVTFYERSSTEDLIYNGLDPICDHCINIILKEKEIEQIPGNYLFGLNDLG